MKLIKAGLVKRLSNGTYRLHLYAGNTTVIRVFATYQDVEKWWANISKAS